MLAAALATLTGCSASPGLDKNEEPNSEVGDVGSAFTIPDDPDLQWLKDNGFGSVIFANWCTSKGNDPSDIGGDSLPVGNGRWLECVTNGKPSNAAWGVVSTNGEAWCALGSVSNFSIGGDPRLTLGLQGIEADGTWRLRGDYYGADSITIEKVGNQFGGSQWPIHVNVHYETIDMKQKPGDQSCEQAYGI